jgi:hypothetical protein
MIPNTRKRYDNAITSPETRIHDVVATFRYPERPSEGLGTKTSVVDRALRAYEYITEGEVASNGGKYVLRDVALPVALPKLLLRRYMRCNIRAVDGANIPI